MTARYINTSDETVNVDCDRFIAECAVQSRGSHTDDRRREDVGPQEVGPPQPNPYRRGEQMRRDAEGLTTRQVAPSGELINPVMLDNLRTKLEVSTHYDEEYMAIGGHIDYQLQERIVNFEYVDFVKLIPKDKVCRLEDQRFELVVKGGLTFFSPVAEREVTSISNFSRWEQAFRIYSNIITRVYPAKASELIQYNHTIYTAALTFA